MDFSLDPELARLQRRTRDFVNEIIMPVESDRTSWDEHENIRLDRLPDLQAKARTAGLWAPQTPQELGGMGLSRVAMAVMYQEANRSIFGPVALNAAAPDDGNMMLLAAVGTPAQQDRWLRPDRRGSGALGLRHDRAGAGRRLGSWHDPHPRDATRRPLGHRGPQVVHHRGGCRAAIHRHRAHLGRSAPWA